MYLFFEHIESSPLELTPQAGLEMVPITSPFVSLRSLVKSLAIVTITRATDLSTATLARFFLSAIVPITVTFSTTRQFKWFKISHNDFVRTIFHFSNL